MIGNARGCWVIAKREFLERVRSRWFLIVTLLGPVLMVGSTVFAAKMAKKQALRATRIELVSRGDEKLAEIVAAGLQIADPNLQVMKVASDTPREELLARIERRDIDGYIDLPADLLGGGTIDYYGSNATSFAAIARMEAGVQIAVIGARAEQAGLDPERLAMVLRPVRFVPKYTTGEGESSSGAASFVVGYIAMLVTYIGILLYGQNVLRSVILEKTSRVVEVIVSTVRPFAFMAGKILGVGTLGLLQMGIWAVMALLLLRYRVALLGMLGVSQPGSWSIPPFGLDAVVIVLLFFLLGYFFYASLYAAVGALCNSDQEAQQVQTPVTLLLVVPAICMPLIGNDARGPEAVVLTQIPFTSPVLVPMRYLLGGVQSAELVLSAVVLLVSIAAAVWLSAKVYRIGILMYGKRPSLREIIHWVRY
ncbi:MAG: ABC transporter permease [Pseudomonadota bacterium]